MVALVTEISGRDAYRRDAQIQVYPVGKGTWTVRAFIDGKQKRFTGLKGHDAVVFAFLDAQHWLDEQAAR